MNLPVPSTLNHEGAVYRIPPLGLGDLLEHAKWLRDEHIAEAKRQMVGLPLEVANHMIDEARKEAKQIVVGTAEYREAALEFSGRVYGLWLALRKEDKSFPISKVHDFFNVENMERALIVSAEVLGFVRSDPTKPVDPAP